jgi:hypothetical protein
MITGEDDTHASTGRSKEIFDSLENVRHKKYIEVAGGDHFMMNWEHSYQEV